jgi:hypothetical protein
MPASEAQIRANQANAAKSTGPKTPEGKAVSRANSYKHGLTGLGVVMPDVEAEEVERRFEAFTEELNPSGAMGLTLLRRAATLAVRMEKCSERELGASTERVARALADFTPPEGADAAEIARLRIEVAREAAFDPSPEATLARRYEAAAERGFYRALKEFRLVEKQAQAISPDLQAEIFRQELGSYLDLKKMDDEMEALYPELAVPGPQNGFKPAPMTPQTMPKGRVDVPITIGRPR